MPSRNVLSSVLVPTDLSDGALLALQRALHLPLGPKSKVTLLHVLPDDIPGRLRKEALGEAERGLERVLGQVRELAERKALSPAQFVVDVVEGEPTAQVLKRAHTVEADVICVGRHGRSRIPEVVIGSTAKKIVKAGDVPVLLVRSPTVNPYRRALAAVDLSKTSLAQLKSARPYVESAMALEVLYASSLPYEDFVTMPVATLEGLRQEELVSARSALATLLGKSGLVRADAKVVAGDARMLILEEAKAFNAELVIVGTRGLKGAARIVLGSVAEWVMTHVSADVLVTRG